MKEKWMDRLGLPDEYALARSLIEIADDCRVLIEHHCGVIGYGCRQICVKVKFGIVTVSGRDLELRRMSGEQLIISGKIDAVALHRRGRNDRA